MCFFIQRKPDGTYNHIPERAEKDILVYKVMYKGSWLSRSLRGVKSLHKKFFYNTNEIMPFVDIHPDRERVEEGYHSYSTFNKAYNHVYRGYAVFEFIIPSGATYFYNATHEEYVSSYIRLKSFKPLKA